MIISNKHNFIYVKPYKVASTTLHYELSRHCDLSTDRVSLLKMRNLSKQDKRSLKGKPIGNIEKNHLGWKEARRVVRRMPDREWGDYLKILSVRNPWAMMPSYYRMVNRRRRRAGRSRLPKFNTWVANIIKRELPNRPHWFEKGKLFEADFFVRFEYIEEDIQELFKILELEYEPIVRLRHRAKKVDYRELYNKETRELVAKAYEPVISRFGYVFNMAE